MFFSGISDEAGPDIETQIAAHRELGWTDMELRLVDGENITAISDEKFEQVRERVSEAGMTVSCFGSAIANWSRPITGDLKMDIDDLKRAIPRMHALGTGYIRVMSYPNDPDSPIDERDWRIHSVARMKILAKFAEEGGITLVHENCSGWGGMSAENSTILLNDVGSPALKLVFDTGNPVTYGQDTWEYYMAVEKDIVHVHIKDARRVNDENGYTYCGEGDGCVREVITDLLVKGYKGGLSIEPHLAAVIHTGERSTEEGALYKSYTEYGRRLMRIVEEVRSAREVSAT